MRLLLVIETPDTDDLQYPIISRALWEYANRAVDNNSERCEQVDQIGMDGGPNTMACSNGCRVTEMRIDAPRFFWRAFKRLFWRAT